MKLIIPILVGLILYQPIVAQITTPVIKANFGVDGELRANYWYPLSLSGNDDWFNMSFGAGRHVIDTTGAASIVSQYTTDLDFRKLPFFRTMSVEPYSLMNNKLVIDAVFIRDYHGSDSTMFASGASKNGMSPADWSCPVAQSIPDKNEILDMMVHVRRAGPNPTDSLWMFGGISIENTTGNRYFDFEMYQTDIYYDRASLKFYGYGPDAGHTSWQFDGSGNVTVPGDIIFTAEYSSNSLTAIEARIWVHQSALSITPVGFSWTGSFDGASSGAQYGYAGITPSTAGTFYTGLTSPANTWAGPFKLVLGDNSVTTTYTAGQFMEFSVNLTKLGLDPVTLLGGDDCGMPFRRVLVKSRASTSFTAALKDFVGPFDFFLAPRATAAADIPVFCGSNAISTITVNNAVSTSEYTWTTPDGHIVGSNSGPEITVDSPGTYIVTQRLQSGCSVYATDTVSVTYDPGCALLEDTRVNINGRVSGNSALLNWQLIQSSAPVVYYEIERSINGLQFDNIGRINAAESIYTAFYADDISAAKGSYLYYRVKVVSANGAVSYSPVIRLLRTESAHTQVIITPKPVKDVMQVTIASPADKKMQLFIYDYSGRLMRTTQSQVGRGNTSFTLTGFSEWQKGLYAVKILLDDEVFVEKLLVD